MMENDHSDTSSQPEAGNRNTAKSQLPVGRQLAILSAVMLAMFGIGGAWAYLKKDEPPATLVADSLTDPAPIVGEDETLTFSELELLAESAIVFDMKTGRTLYEKEADMERPLASITKLMTALVAKEIVTADTVISMTPEALSQSGDNGFVDGDRFSYQRLSDMMLIISSNDGAYALAAAAGAALDANDPEAAFVKAMNVRAKELNLRSLTFRNPTGLDIGEAEAGAYGTARDVSALMAYIVSNYPELIEETAMAVAEVTSADGEVIALNNTNLVVNEVAKVIGSKTGYTTLAGGNLVMAFDAGLNRPVIAVVLGSSYQGRFSDMVQLVQAATNEINRQN